MSEDNVQVIPLRPRVADSVVRKLKTFSSRKKLQKKLQLESICRVAFLDRITRPRL